MHAVYEGLPLDTKKGEIRLLTLHAVDEINPDGMIECDLENVLLSNNCTQYIEFEKTGQKYIQSTPQVSNSKPRRGFRSWAKGLRRSKEGNKAIELKPHDPNRFHYVALSYTWGEDIEKDKRSIMINGHIFKVRRNLYAALLQFRTMEKFKRGVKLWIDAITINQDDEEEKGAQILIMHEIYQCAGNIVVWVGPESETEFDSGKDRCEDCVQQTKKDKSDVPNTIRVLEEISQYYQSESFEEMDGQQDLTRAHQHREGAAFRLRTALAQWKDLMRENPDFFTGNSYKSMWEFFDREYWRRLWIIQEVAMGNAKMPIICGSRVTHWCHIRDAAILLHSAMDIVSDMTRLETNEEEEVATKSHTASHVAGIAQLELLSHRKRLPNVDKSHFEFTSRAGIGGGEALRGTTLDQALALAMQADCRVDRDRVFGMIHIYGIPESIKRSGLLDFAATPAVTYTKFSKHLLQLGKFEIFALLDGCVDPFQLPSWVPNFARPASRRTNPIHGPWFADGVNRFDNNDSPFYQAPMMLPIFVEIDIGREVLCLNGVTLVDTIDGIGAMQPQLTKRIMSSNSSFATGVVQPSKPKTKTNPLYEREHVVKRCIYRTLTCSVDVTGHEKDFKRLLSCLTSDDPLSDASGRWNWDFFNASAALEFHGKPLRDWMEPYVARLDSLDYASDEERKDWGEVSAAMAAMKSKVRCRRLFVTAERGFLGLGPMNIQPGYLLATVFGCAKPVILQPLGGGRFRFQGECYVDDIMEGEVEKLDIPDSDIGRLMIE